MAASNEDFLARWSRRKVEARQGLRRKEGEPERQPAPAERAGADEGGSGQTITQSEEHAALPLEKRQEQGAAAAPDEQAPGESAGEEEVVDPSEFDDVDFDKLDYDSDYTRFMKAGVPEAIKRRALRMLWQSNPVLANLDGLNDYDEDFTDAALAVKSLATSWKVGSGYLTEEERKASYGDTEEHTAEAKDATVDQPAQSDDLDKEKGPGAEPETEVAEAETEPEQNGTAPPASGQPDNEKA